MPANRNDAMDAARGARSGDDAPDPSRTADIQRVSSEFGVSPDWVSNANTRRIKTPEVNVVGRSSNAQDLYVQDSATPGPQVLKNFPTGHLSDGGFQQHFVDSGRTFSARGNARYDGYGNTPGNRVDWEGIDFVK